MVCCRAITQLNDSCSRNALKSGYCKQHDKDYKIEMYRKELSKMHQRVRYYIQKISKFWDMLNDIERVDYIKFRLTEIGGPEKSFRSIINDIRYKNELESLFDLPFDEINKAYFGLITRRNNIVHKWMMRGWETGDAPKILNPFRVNDSISIRKRILNYRFDMT